MMTNYEQLTAYEQLEKQYKQALTEVRKLQAQLDAVKTNAFNALSSDDVEWIVNSRGELGVLLGERMFWMYKGESLEYTQDQHHEDGEGPSVKWRLVGKREFGEVCEPQIRLGARMTRYPLSASTLEHLGRHNLDAPYLEPLTVHDDEPQRVKDLAQWKPLKGYDAYRNYDVHRAAQKLKVDVPAGIYYDPEKDNFYDQTTKAGMGQEFYAQWYHHREFFPSHRPDMLARDLVVPETCQHGEQWIFERIMKDNGYDMSQHPMFYIFLNEKTASARFAWREALCYANKLVNDQLYPPSSGHNYAALITKPEATPDPEPNNG